jgi:hypothetical protein
VSLRLAISWTYLRPYILDVRLSFNGAKTSAYCLSKALTIAFSISAIALYKDTETHISTCNLKFRFED